MMNRRTLLHAFAASAALAASSPTPGRAAPAAAVDTIKGFYDTLLAVMKQAKPLGLKGRYEQLDPAMRRAFNLALMTRLSIGPEWQKLSPEEQGSLTAAFSDFSISNYAARFDGYDGEHFEVDPNPAPTSGGVVVNTKLVETSGKVVQLNYLMREGDAGWQILDVYLMGTVSELATKRSEYSTVLRRDGAQALLRLIQGRAAELKKEG